MGTTISKQYKKSLGKSGQFAPQRYRRGFSTLSDKEVLKTSGTLNAA
tara:strand:- start:2689 stop:2829 length:141 start_codon:yes stop_codon:yes gene_type:complete